MSEKSNGQETPDLRRQLVSGIMPDLIHLQLLLATFAVWVTRNQAQVIYLVEENRVLKEQILAKVATIVRT